MVEMGKRDKREHKEKPWNCTKEQLQDLKVNELAEIKYTSE